MTHIEKIRKRTDALAAACYHDDASKLAERVWLEAEYAIGEYLSSLNPNLAISVKRGDYLRKGRP